ncbi:hypothetical protein DQG13_23320 [Paenibacillus sp. YN15]|nr:hypothetical protein DQG13_23320 [Paenibacillus sp. YN15]
MTDDIHAFATFAEVVPYFGGSLFFACALGQVRKIFILFQKIFQKSSSRFFYHGKGQGRGDTQRNFKSFK